MEKEQRLDIDKIIAKDFADAEVISVDNYTHIQSPRSYWIAFQLTSAEAFKDWLLYFQDIKNDRGYVHGFEYVKVFYVQKVFHVVLKTLFDFCVLQ